MFVRPCWEPQSIADVYGLIEDNPLGLLVSNHPDGPLVTNLPWILDRDGGTHGVLRSHIARANAHSLALVKGEAPVLAVVHGPSRYITASWYPERNMPSTVYYTAVHCYGRLSFQDDRALRAALEELTTRCERDVFDGWKTSDIPESDIQRRLPAILGFELVISRLEAKFKLGQDEPIRDAMAVADKLLASTDAKDRKFGELVRRYNQDRTS